MNNTVRFSDPVAAFDAAVSAINAEDWGAAARLCDPVSLRSFHRNLLVQFTTDSRIPELTAEDILRHTPDMPREVAEYQVAKHRSHSDPAQRLRQEMPSVASVAALMALSPADAFAAWLDGRSIRRLMTQLAESRGRAVDAAELSAAVNGSAYRYVAIGALESGERVAHVLYRMGMDDSSAWGEEFAASLAALPEDEQAFARDMSLAAYPQVATCLRQADRGWALIADHGFLGMGSVVAYSEPAAESDPGPGLDT